MVALVAQMGWGAYPVLLRYMQTVSGLPGLAMLAAANFIVLIIAATLFWSRIEKDWIQYAQTSYDGDYTGTHYLGDAEAKTLTGAIIGTFRKLDRNIDAAGLSVKAPVPYEFPTIHDPSMVELESILGKAEDPR